MNEDIINTSIYKELRNTNEFKENEFKKSLESIQDEFSKKLNESNFEDKRLELLLKEIKDSEGQHQKNLVKVLKEVQEKSSETDKASSKHMLKKLDELNNSQNDLKKLQKEIKRTEELNNPLNAFKHAIEDLKEKGVVKGAKTLGSGLKESMSQQMTFANMSKTLLHGAGVALDLPALNILASEIKADSKTRNEDNEKTIKSLEAIQEQDVIVNEDKDDTISSNIKELKDENVVLNDIDKFTDVILALKDIKDINSDIYTDLGSVLEDIRELLQTDNVSSKVKDEIKNVKIQEDNNEVLEDIKDEIKVQNLQKRDELDDNLVTKASFTDVSSKVKEVKEPESKDESSLLDMFGSGKGGGLLSKGKGLLGKGAGLISKFGPGLLSKGAGLLGKLGPIALAGKAGYDAFQGYQNADENLDLKEGQEATTKNKTSSALGSVVGGLTFGLADTKETSKGINNLIGGNEDIQKFEKDGIINHETFGDSEVTDWKKLEQLPKSDIQKIIDIDDWSEEDKQRMVDILNKEPSKKISPSKVSKEPIPAKPKTEKKDYAFVRDGVGFTEKQAQDFAQVYGSNPESKEALAYIEKLRKTQGVQDINAKPKEQKSLQQMGDEKVQVKESAPANKSTTTESKEQQPIVITQKSGSAQAPKIQQYNLENDNLITIMQLKGVRL